MKRKILCLLLVIGCMATLLGGCANFPLENLAGLFGGSEASNLPEPDESSGEKDVTEEYHFQIVIPSDGDEENADKPNKVIIITPDDSDDNDKPVESSKPQKEEKPVESSKPAKENQPASGDVSYTLPSNMFGKFVSTNASGDGEDVLRESWTFGKGDGSFKVDGNIPFWAEYRAEMLDSGGEVYSVLDQKYFEYGYFRNGDLYLVCGPDVYGPYFIEVYNNSILIKAYQFMGSPVERYYDRL